MDKLPSQPESDKPRWGRILPWLLLRAMIDRTSTNILLAILIVIVLLMFVLTPGLWASLKHFAANLLLICGSSLASLIGRLLVFQKLLIAILAITASILSQQFLKNLAKEPPLTKKVDKEQQVPDGFDLEERKLLKAKRNSQIAARVVFVASVISSIVAIVQVVYEGLSYRAGLNHYYRLDYHKAFSELLAAKEYPFANRIVFSKALMVTAYEASKLPTNYYRQQELMKMAGDTASKLITDYGEGIASRLTLLRMNSSEGTPQAQESVMNARIGLLNEISMYHQGNPSRVTPTAIAEAYAYIALSYDDDTWQEQQFTQYSQQPEQFGRLPKAIYREEIYKTAERYAQMATDADPQSAIANYLYAVVVYDRMKNILDYSYGAQVYKSKVQRLLIPEDKFAEWEASISTGLAKAQAALVIAESCQARFKRPASYAMPLDAATVRLRGLVGIAQLLSAEKRIKDLYTQMRYSDTRRLFTAHAGLWSLLEGSIEPGSDEDVLSAVLSQTDKQVSLLVSEGKEPPIWVYITLCEIYARTSTAAGYRSSLEYYNRVNTLGQHLNADVREVLARLRAELYANPEDVIGDTSSDYELRARFLESELARNPSRWPTVPTGH
jgi:hypothetical protein